MRQAGFSLLELLIAVAVAAVLVSLAAPNLHRAVVKNQVVATANDLVGDLQTARTQAVSRGVSVGVVASGGEWRRGWQVQPDGDAATSGYQAATDTPIRQHEALADDAVLRAEQGGSALTQVVFAANGSIVGATADIALHLCRPAGTLAQAVRIEVSPVGQIRSHRDAGVSGASCP